MKVIKCKLQSQTSRPINERQKDYYIMCPIREVSVGNTVLVEYSMRSKKNRKHKYTYLAIAKVEEIYEGKASSLMKEYHPTSTAVCMLEEKVQDYDEFWKRLNKAKYMTNSIYHNYVEPDHNEAALLYETRKKARNLKNKKKRMKRKNLKNTELAGYVKESNVSENIGESDVIHE